MRSECIWKEMKVQLEHMRKERSQFHPSPIQTEVPKVSGNHTHALCIFCCTVKHGIGRTGNPQALLLAHQFSRALHSGAAPVRWRELRAGARVGAVVAEEWSRSEQPGHFHGADCCRTERLLLSDSRPKATSCQDGLAPRFAAGDSVQCGR